MIQIEVLVSVSSVFTVFTLTAVFLCTATVFCLQRISAPSLTILRTKVLSPRRKDGGKDKGRRVGSEEG